MVPPEYAPPRHGQEWHRKWTDLVREIWTAQITTNTAMSSRRSDSATADRAGSGRPSTPRLRRVWLRSLGQPKINIKPRSHLLGENRFGRFASDRRPRQVEYCSLCEGAAGLCGRTPLQRHDVRRTGNAPTVAPGPGRSSQHSSNPPGRPPVTCAQVLLRHLFQAVSPARHGSANLKISHPPVPDDYEHRSDRRAAAQLRRYAMLLAIREFGVAQTTHSETPSESLTPA